MREKKAFSVTAQSAEVASRRCYERSRPLGVTEDRRRSFPERWIEATTAASQAPAGVTHNLLERSASLPVRSGLLVKVTTQSGAAYQVDIDGEQVRVGHQGVHADIVRPNDDVMVYSALGFPDPVVVRRHELVIGSERIPLSEIGASAADQLALEGFAALLEGAAKQLRIASSNAEKLKDFRAALSPLGIAVVAPEKLPLDVIEDGKTYEDNALKKVRAWVAMTGQACVADDSGIAIDALGGAPGVHSARYSGVNGAGRHQANNDKILKNLGDTPDEQRTATISTVLAYQVPGEQPLLFRADVKGRVIREPKGELGWASDVLFIPDGCTKTLAELSGEERLKYTSRHRALQMLLAYLETQQKE